MSKNDTKGKQNVVFFIGAGFSAPFGLPVTSNFIDKAEYLYNSDNDKYSDLNKTLELIRRYSPIKDYMNIDLYNVEDLFSFPYMERILDNNKESIVKDSEEFVKTVIAACSETAMDNINEYIDMKSDKDIEHFGDLLRFVYFISDCAVRIEGYGSFYPAIEKLGIVEKSFSNESNFPYTKIIPQYDIITTNYDNILEKSKEILKSYFKSHLRSHLLKKHAPENPKNDQMNMINKAAIESMVDKWAKERIRIKKLHGSVDGNIIPPIRCLSSNMSLKIIKFT